MSLYNIVIEYHDKKYHDKKHYDKNWCYSSNDMETKKIIENGEDRVILIKNTKDFFLKQIYDLIKNIKLMWDSIDDHIVVCEDYSFGNKKQFISLLNGDNTNIIENNLLILTVATKEVSDKKISQWKYTVNNFGYKYLILGRSDKWQGFKTKISLYMKELKNIKEKYVCAVDCTDLFFCAYWWETIIKIKNINSCVVGGEKFMMYNKGKYPYRRVHDTISKKHNLYPNSGYIIGKTTDLLDLFTFGKNYNDDQALCYDIIVENKKIHMVVDDLNSFVANIPDYGLTENLNIYNTLSYDPSCCRYKNLSTKNYPVALHYPNKNWLYMDIMYKSLFLTELSEMPTRNTYDDTWVIPAVIVLFLFFFILFYYYVSHIPKLNI